MRHIFDVMTKAKINTEVKNKLFSANADEVITAINLLKEEGNKNYLPVLFELLVSKPDPEIEKEIVKLLGTVKDKETVSVFADALTNENFTSIRKTILTTCWQNGLDFAPHMNLLAELVINEPWEVAFEAFTIIENFEHFPPEEELKDIKLKIARALKSADEQKAYFLEEILKMTAH